VEINVSQGYLIGIDIGTTTSKGVVITAGGDVVAEYTLEHGVSHPHPGWAEHDADEVWWGDFVRICRALIQKSSVDQQQILAVACSSLGPALLPVDGDGRPLRPGILYSIDLRVVEEVEILKNSLGDDYSLDASASRFSPQIILPKILWVQRHEPDVFRKTAKFLNASGYVVFRLTRNFVTDHASASIGGLPYNFNTLGWDEAACREVSISPDQLPRIFFANKIAGTVSAGAALETGLAQGTPVAVGTFDHMAAVISLGALKRGRAVIGYGTTLSLDVCTDKLTYFPGLMYARSCLSGNAFISGGAMSAAGGLTKWFKENFGQIETELEQRTGVNAYASLSNLAGTIKPGSEGLIVLPYFNGERCPILDPRARGVIFGLTLRHTRAHIYRAILEGAGYGARHIMDILETGGSKIKEVTIVGGGTLSGVWTQIISDITQLEQRLLRHNGGSHYGAAYLAGLAAGAMDYSVIDRQWDNCNTVVTPNPENRNIYDKYYNIYRNLYDKTAEEMHSLE
jgi:xylulokinase